jgi:hypothetical protein
MNNLFAHKKKHPEKNGMLFYLVDISYFLKRLIVLT